MESISRRGTVRRPSLARTLSAAAVVALLVVACGSSATPTASLGPIQLEGTSWRLISYLSPTGTNFTVPSAVTPGATFSNGQFQGDTGCNQANGPYTLNGTAIKIGPISSTKKACPEPMATVELAYLAALAVVDTATGNDKTLLLKQSDGFSALEFVRAN